MNKLNLLIIGFLLVNFSSLAKANKSFKNAVRRSVIQQLETYPQSTLKDLYKNFFQDEFGPGHIVSDTATAGKYLRLELENNDHFNGKDFESLGWQGNFVRVNLRLIKDTIIPYNTYFQYFIESVSLINTITQEKWIEEWTAIDSIICTMNLRLPNFENDRLEIFSLLRSGKSVIHHSEIFEKAYEPHYRIMDKKHAEALQSSFPIHFFK
jgi:hypothetical protein